MICLFSASTWLEVNRDDNAENTMLLLVQYTVVYNIVLALNAVRSTDVFSRDCLVSTRYVQECRVQESRTKTLLRLCVQCGHQRVPDNSQSHDRARARWILIHCLRCTSEFPFISNSTNLSCLLSPIKIPFWKATQFLFYRSPFKKEQTFFILLVQSSRFRVRRNFHWKEEGCQLTILNARRRSLINFLILSFSFSVFRGRHYNC